MKPGQSLLVDPFAELANSSDVGARIAALLVTLGDEQRESARASRAIAERAQRVAEDEELAEMRSEAGMKLGAGLFEGAFKIGGGICRFAGAGDKGAVGDRLRASADAVDGSGKIGSAAFTHCADINGMDAKRAEQGARREKTAADDAREIEKDARDLIQRAIGYYKEYLTAKSEVQRSSLLRA